ncbi:MAG TPA: DUF4388 domain-containing protein [Pyrinomonadaceae bacterium]|nr:DUF4388 domain-containing protein [Pyrinomonadaceae bacterium]
MGIRGTLNTMSVSDLLQFLASGRKTGTLKLGLGDIVKHIYLEDGIIVGSSSNDPKEYLGQVLLHYGKIDEAQLQAAMEIQRQSGGKLGVILSSRGFLSQANIVEVLRTRTLEIIYDLFIWEEAHFEFFDSEPPPQDLIRIRVEVTKVIMDGIYRIDEWSRYRTVIPSDRTFFELIPGWTHSLGNASPETRQVLYHVEKHMTAAEICYNMHTSLFHACALLFDLVDKGFIKVAGEAPAPVEVSTDLSALNLPQTVPELLKLARVEIKENNAENALAIIHSALEQEAKNPEAQRLREEAEKKLVAQIYAGGLSPRAMPRILVTTEQLEHERLGPQEGFVLSRINGESDIESILSVCPFREADSLRMIKKLLDGGIIGLK